MSSLIDASFRRLSATAAERGWTDTSRRSAATGARLSAVCVASPAWWWSSRRGQRRHVILSARSLVYYLLTAQLVSRGARMPSGGLLL